MHYSQQTVGVIRGLSYRKNLAERGPGLCKGPTGQHSEKKI